MVLTSRQRQIVASKLNSLAPKGQPNCSVCTFRQWLIQDRIFEMREFFHGDLVLGNRGQVIPVVALVCANCGNIMLFNAIKLGVVSPQDDRNHEGKPDD